MRRFCPPPADAAGEGLNGAGVGSVQALAASAVERGSVPLSTWRPPGRFAGRGHALYTYQLRQWVAWREINGLDALVGLSGE